MMDGKVTDSHSAVHYVWRVVLRRSADCAVDGHEAWTSVGAGERLSVWGRRKASGGWI